jgi:hypothetical protein
MTPSKIAAEAERIARKALKLEADEFDDAVALLKRGEGPSWAVERWRIAYDTGKSVLEELTRIEP